MHRRIYIGLTIIAAVLFAVVLPYCGRWWRIDKCLDAGGAWNEPSGKCVFSKDPIAP